jgi:hypothetical protein
MHIDRRTFLALATMIAGAASPACSSQAADDLDNAEGAVVAPSDEGYSCLADDDEPYPSEEGHVCDDIEAKGFESDYAYWTADEGDGRTRAEHFGCQPASPAHPAVDQKTPICADYLGAQAARRCLTYVTQFKQTAASTALYCMGTIDNFVKDFDAVYRCGLTALDTSCVADASADAACHDLATVLAQHGRALDDEEEVSCSQRMNGLRDPARADILAAAASDAWYGLTAAIADLHVPADLVEGKDGSER